jgi:hypothetical protein
MTSSYDVLAAINVDRIAGHPISGGMAQGGDAASYVLGHGQTFLRIALARDLNQFLMARNEA